MLQPIPSETVSVNLSLLAIVLILIGHPVLALLSLVASLYVDSREDQ